MQHLDIETARQYLAGALAPDDQARWTAHLQECAACRELLAAERQFASVLRLGADAPGDARREDSAERLERAVAAAQTERCTGARWLNLAAGLLALLFLVMCMVWQLRGVQDPRAVWAAELGVTPDVLTNVVARLGPLQTLQREPWLATRLDAVQILDNLLSQGEQR